MLEILYDTTDFKVIAWCSNEARFGNFTPQDGEAIAILPIDPPSYPSEQFYIDLVALTVSGEPLAPEPDTVRVLEICATSSGAITLPEVWELLRIFAKKLGYPVED